MKRILILTVVVIVLGVGFYITNDNQNKNMDEQITVPEEKEEVNITPISHATMVLTWGDDVLYVDPVGGADAFAGSDKPDIIFITDIHGDHLNAETLEGVIGSETVILAPQAVADQLPEKLSGNVTVISNGDTIDINNLSVEAVPMYNIPENEDSFHVKGRGNGYTIGRDGTRVYIAGDTADIPEMRQLKNIDIAFVPMNLPFTMTVEAAADAVIEFSPKKVYPYHYRGREGLSDVDEFKRLVNEGNPDVEVVLLNWYPES